MAEKAFEYINKGQGTTPANQTVDNGPSQEPNTTTGVANQDHRYIPLYGFNQGVYMDPVTQKMILDYQLKHDLEDQRTRNKGMLQELKHHYDLEKQSFIEERKDRRAEGMMRRTEELKNLKTAVVLDSDGYFCIESTFSDGKKKVSPAVLKTAWMKMFRLVDGETGKCIAQRITWSQNPEKSIVLCRKDCSFHGFLRYLEMAGEALNVSDNKRKKVASLIYSFIAKRSSAVHVYTHLGWNKSEEGWDFIREGDERLVLDGYSLITDVY